MSNRRFAAVFALIVGACLASPVEAADRLRFAILKTGTVGWEIELIKARLKLKDDEALETYRKRYLDGIPKRPIAEEAADARILYRALADIGGKGIAGDARELDAGLFYDPKKGE